jgi:hypothetical protein
MPIGRQVTFIDPEYSSGRWLGFTGIVKSNPFYEICRSQQDVEIQGDWRKLLNEVRDSHWMMAYGDHLQPLATAALYPEVCRHLGKTRSTVALVLRVPVNGPLPQKPEVCAVYLGDNLYDTTVGDASGFYPSLPVAFQERAYRLSRHDIPGRRGRDKRRHPVRQRRPPAAAGVVILRLGRRRSAGQRQTRRQRRRLP